jgi:hypothetical protein
MYLWVAVFFNEELRKTLNGRNFNTEIVELRS